MSAIDIEALAAILREAAIAEIMPRFRRLDEGMVREKSSAIDLVTEADEAAERMIIARLRDLAPEAQLVGEEAAAADPSIMDGLGEAELAVVIDPVDGTFNFASELPLFGTMAGVVVRGETIAGILYDPVGDDWVLAEKGSGAFQAFPDGRKRRLRVADPVPLSEMTGMASTGMFAPQERADVMARLAQVKFAASYRCAAHEYRTAAAGYVHFLMFNKLMPWDHLPGALIMQEAGAHVARFDGSAYLPHHREGGLICAPDEDSWTVFRDAVLGGITA